MSAIIDINPFESIVTMGGESKKVSIKDIVDLLTGGNPDITVLLPPNTVHYLSRNRSYLVSMQFNPAIIPEVDYEVSDNDLERDEAYYTERIRERCIEYYSNSPPCREGEGEEECYNCDVRPCLEETEDGYYAGDIATFHNIPTPRLLITVVLGEYKGTFFPRHTAIHALKEDITKYDIELYRSNFGNIDSSGIVCWGAHVFTGTTSLNFLSSMFSQFFAFPFNGDLDNPHSSVKDLINTPYYSNRFLLAHLAGKSEYPEALLVPAGYTYEELVKRMESDYMY